MRFHYRRRSIVAPLLLAVCLLSALKATAEDDPIKQAELRLKAILDIKSRGGDVGLNGMGDVTEVAMPGRNFSDAQVVLLKQFPKLEIVDLDESAVTDAGLAVLAQLPNVKELYLSGTAVSDAGLKSVQGLQDLRSLHLIGCRKITDAGLAVVGKLTNLRELALDETRIGDDGFTHLRPLTKLEVLGLENSKIGDAGLEQIGGLRELRELNLYGTKFTDKGLKHLQNLTKLEKLNLSFCYEITDRGLVALEPLTNLKTLDLTGSRLLSDGAILHLQKLKNLEELDVQRTRISRDGLTALKKSLPKTKITASSMPTQLSTSTARQQLAVTVIVDGPLTNALKQQLIRKLVAACSEPDYSTFIMSSRRDSTYFEVSPVVDVGDFQEAVDFGTGAKVDVEDRTLRVTLAPAKSAEE